MGEKFLYFFQLSALACQIEKKYFNRNLICNFKRQICPKKWVKNFDNFFNLTHDNFFVCHFESSAVEVLHLKVVVKFVKWSKIKCGQFNKKSIF